MVNLLTQHGPFETATDPLRRHMPHERLLGAFVTSRSGAAAVEFTLVVIPFLMFVLAIIQVAYYHFSLQSLDNATRMASRRIMIGEVQLQGLTATKFKTDVLCPGLTLTIPCAAVTVNVSPVAKASSASLNTGIYALIRPSIPDLNPVNLDSDGGDFCAAGPGTYMFVDVAYNYLGLAGITGLLFRDAAAANAMVLRSTSFIYNEPFPNSAAPASGC